MSEIIALLWLCRGKVELSSSFPGEKCDLRRCFASLSIKLSKPQFLLFHQMMSWWLAALPQVLMFLSDIVSKN